MKSPLAYAAQSLGYLEDRSIPYQALWWRYWTPRIPPGDRYGEDVFYAYRFFPDEDDNAFNLRRILSFPLLRTIYSKLPYIDVVPHGGRETGGPGSFENHQREAFAVEATLAAYNAGKALYPRSTIAQIESQLNAAGAKLARRREPNHHHWHRLPLNLTKKRIRHTLFSHCTAPQSAFLSYPAYDDVTTHAVTWAPGAEQHNRYTPDSYVPGRSQIEFRTIQELTQVDPEAGEFHGEPFLGDGRVAGVAFQPLEVVRKMNWEVQDFSGVFGEGESPWLGREEMEERLREEVERVGKSGEWEGLVKAVVGSGDGGDAEGGVLKGVDKVVFFYAAGLREDYDHCRRAMVLLAVAVCLRELVQQLGGRPAVEIPIFLLAVVDGVRPWDSGEKEFLSGNGVEFVESTGEMFLKVDERTVVVSYKNHNPVKQVVADMAKPALLVCRSVSENPDQDFAWMELEHLYGNGKMIKVPRVRSRAVDRSAIIADPDSPRVRKLVNEYERYDLPELPVDSFVTEREDMSLYLRKPGVSTEVEYW